MYIYSHLIPFVYSMIYISSMRLVIPQSTEASPSSWLCAFTQDRPCRGGRYREVGSLLQRKTDLLALPKGAVICWSRWLLLSLGYPLANVYIAIENHIVLWENSLFLWPCSIAIYVCLPEGVMIQWWWFLMCFHRLFILPFHCRRSPWWYAQ